MSLSLLENYKIKLIVFVFAVFIWFFVITENEYEHIIDVPVNTVNLPEDKVVLSEIPATAKVKVKGSGKDLIALGVSSAARVDLDLSDIADSKTFVLEPKSVFLSRPTGAILTEEIITPDSIHVVVDDFSAKTVAIEPRIVVDVAPGFTAVGGMKLTPDSVRLSGPESIITQIEKLPTVEQRFSDLKFDLRRIVSLADPPSDKIEISILQTEVFLNVQELVELTISGVPVQVRNAPRDMAVYPRPTTLSLVLEGGGELLTRIDRDDIVAYIDYRRVRQSPAREHAARIIPPPGVSYRDVQPKKFRLVFEKEGQ